LHIDYVLGTARLHRWHDARRVEDAECNYGGPLIVRDLLFGLALRRCASSRTSHSAG
jgi:sterol desaturase/sphingolipid hydroxylase (fatty acid hydroxylase superfamily)